jgi:hypothetical protein
MVSDAIRREIRQRDLIAGDGETLRAIAAQLIDGATAGDLTMIKELRDTLDGKPAQSVKLSGDEDSPLVVQEIARKIIE